MREHGWGRRTTRILALLGCALLALSAAGWWLSTRVLDSEGFGDVVAKSSQREAVRDYIADQATLRLAPTSNFVTAARPVVADAISAAIHTEPVEQAIHELAARAQKQIFRTRLAARTSIDAAQAAVTVRTALETINPSLAKKVPASVLDASTTVTQSSTITFLLDASPWIDALYLPCGILAVALLALAIGKARERVRALRTVGIALAVTGTAIMGFGAATPLFAAVSSTNEPLRGDAVAQLIEVLVGRFVGAGKAFVVIGLLLALAPGRDGGDLRARVDHVREWFATKRTSRRWRFAGGLALFLGAASAFMIPGAMVDLVIAIVGLGVMYVAVIICLRATGVLEGTPTPRFRKRRLGLVLLSMVATFAITTASALAIVAATTREADRNQAVRGCNGSIELCYQPLDQIMWPASHNAMSSSAYDFFSAEHTITVGEQLNSGIRLLMLDAYYGYDDDGIVRTNLAGGVDRKELEQERGKEAVRQLDRVGALTGAADTSGKRQDLYFCHDFCELGAIRGSDVLGEVADFLDRNTNEVVVLDFEDYVTPKTLEQALQDAGLFDRVWRPPAPGEPLPQLIDIVAPPDEDAYDDDLQDAQRRLIVVSEKHGTAKGWLRPAYSLMEETPFTFPTQQDFNCDPKRGGTGKQLFLVNHWLRPAGPPDPGEAARVNSRAVLQRRISECITQRGKLANFVAVDFTAIGDLHSTVQRYNAAVGRVTGITDQVTKTIRRERDRGDLTAAQARELNGLRRLPRISEAKALELLGPIGPLLVHPELVIGGPPPDDDDRGGDNDDDGGRDDEQPSTTTTTTEAP